MRLFWKRSEDALERALRVERPDAPDGLVSGLVGRVEASRTPRHWSRVAFAGALTVFMLGTFASFGGLGYAAESVQSAASSVTRVVKTQKASAPTKQSAALTQYGPQTVTPPAPAKQTFTPPAAPKTVKVAGISTPAASESSDELPFTGLGLAATAAFGLLLLGLGAFLRRRESRAS
jgi:hypothetical protein